MQWSKGRWCLAVGKALAVSALLAFFFYRSYWALIPMLGVGFGFLKQEMHRSMGHDRDLLLLQFRECILAMSAALKAGYSIENAMLQSAADMKKLFGEKGLICQELDQIRRGMDIHIPLEDLLEDLGRRSGLEDISQFAQIFRIARKNGGNLSQILQSTGEQISSNIEARSEAMSILSGRHMEQRIMEWMPICILLYVEWTTPGYFQDLYHNATGILLMTGCLIVYLVAVFIGERLLNTNA
ncbi:MAG: type II secretion system F family protein [Lachnospiraceae bacterium]|nr:type II secretion system F family protein [Lachnospiraceae bacterium]